MKNIATILIITLTLNSFSQGYSREYLIDERIEIKYYLKAKIPMSIVCHTLGILFYSYRHQHEHLPALIKPVFVFNTIAVSFDISIVSSIFKLRKNKKLLEL